MVISCSSGWVREAWWSTVPSMSSLRRSGGTGTGTSVACWQRGCRRRGALRAGGADIRVPVLIWVHSSVVAVTSRSWWTSALHRVHDCLVASYVTARAAPPTSKSPAHGAACRQFRDRSSKRASGGRAGRDEQLRPCLTCSAARLAGALRQSSRRPGQPSQTLDLHVCNSSDRMPCAP
jgi:hypothetical protein